MKHSHDVEPRKPPDQIAPVDRLRRRDRPYRGRRGDYGPAVLAAGAAILHLPVTEVTT